MTVMAAAPANSVASTPPPPSSPTPPAPLPEVHFTPADGTWRADLARTWGLIRPESAAYARGMAALAAVDVADVASPLFLALAVDIAAHALGGGTVGTPPPLAWMGLDAAQFSMAGAVALYLGLQALANVCRYPMTMNVAVPSHRIVQGLRNTLVAKLFRLPQSFFDRTPSGELMNVATSDLQAVRMALGPGILLVVDTALLVVAVLVLMIALSWELTLAALVPLPLVFWVTNRLSKAEYTRFQAQQDDLDRLTDHARESFAGVRVLQSYARELYDHLRFRDASRRNLGKAEDLARVHALFEPTLELMMGTAMLLVFGLGAWRIVHGDMSVGTFVGFLFLVGHLAGPMIGLGWAAALLQRGRASLRRVDALLSLDTRRPDDGFTAPLVGLGSLEVRRLTFAYPAPKRNGHGGPGEAPMKGQDPSFMQAAVPPPPQHPVLRDISLSLPAGRRLGIMGSVGSGKSTLASLFTRLYEPPPGTIFLDGRDIREIPLDELRRVVTAAPQDTFLFSDTVHRNVALAQDWERAAVVRFTEWAYLRDEIEELSEGFDTILGERGVNLSGGQRQRLACARSFAADPRILILDDSFSAVDAQAEEAILARLDEALAGRSAVLISHRVRALRRCDEIVVLSGGAIVERGTHEELLAQNGQYAAVARAQGDG